VEPIANEHGVQRRPLQYFVGGRAWDDTAVRTQLVEEIARGLGAEDGVILLDASSFPKKGDKSVGVQRQWCGRLGKEDNCQVGEFLGYATSKGHALADCRLYLPKSWVADATRRKEAQVPSEVTFKEGWRLSYEMIAQHRSALPHQWIVGDDAYGRIVELRRLLDADGERYLLEVPSNTQVLTGRRTSRDEWQSVESVANEMAKGKWKRVVTSDGEKGPIAVQAFKVRVKTRAGNGTHQVGGSETLLVTQRGRERWYYLSNAHNASVQKMAKAGACRHFVEQCFELAKTDVGMDEYEVRSWVGWHHHMTLSLMAQYFLVQERARIKKKKTGDQRTTSTLGHRAHSRARRAVGERNRANRKAGKLAIETQ
jgi:SRSO17 transposase